MTDADDVRLDLRGLLAAIEAAPPVEAVNVLAAELARMLDAPEVSLLIANLSGTAAVRMSHATVSQGGVTDGVRGALTNPSRHPYPRGEWVTEMGYPADGCPWATHLTDVLGLEHGARRGGLGWLRLSEASGAGG